MSNELQARLEQARARKEAAEQTRKARAAEAQVLLEVQEAEREAADAEAIDKAEREHGTTAEGKIAIIRTRLGVIILKPPHATLYKRFQDQAQATYTEVETLVRSCLVHPDSSAFDTLIRELPGVMVACGKAVNELAGLRTADLLGK